MKKFRGEVDHRFLIPMMALLFMLFLSLALLGADVEKIETEEENGLDVNVDSNLDELTPNFDTSYGEYVTFLPNPAPFTLEQPDGYEFEARMIAERIGGHVETMEGYSIVENENGWWTYAEKDEKGLLVPSSYIVGRVHPESMNGLDKHLSNDHPDVDEQYESPYERSSRAPPATGTWKAVAIMLEFTDETFDSDHNKSHFSDLLNGTTGNTMRTYYREVSYGTFDIEVDVYGPFESAHHMAYYGGDKFGLDTGDGATARNILEMAREAVQLADNGTDGYDEDDPLDGPDEEVDFTQYDLDSDYIIDALFIIHAGDGQEEGGGANAIWSHMGGIWPWPGEWVEREITSPKYYARPYSTEPETGEVGVFAHEFGHVLGLPDLYDTDGTGSGGRSDGAGDWAIMASGSWNGNPGGSSPAHLCAWSKIRLGWVDPIIVTSDVSLTQLEIPPVENNTVVYKMWTHNSSVNDSEYFLIESRQSLGFDSELPGDGLLIWHIDDSVGTMNNNPNHLRVDLEEADGNEELIEYNYPKGESTDPWKDNVTGFTNTSIPNSSSYDGSDTGVWVWNISDIDPVSKNMSIGFKEINTAPEVGIYISDPENDQTITIVYDFIINDTGFLDEDIGPDNEGNSGSYVLEQRPFGMGQPWEDTPSQFPQGWEGGIGGTIKCLALDGGYWDFRVRIIDEEGHLLYTPVVTNVRVPDYEPPVADAGPDNSTDEDSPITLDGSGSTDNSGAIVWYNWTFGDGAYQNGSEPIVEHTYVDPGEYVVILNVSDAHGNWNNDTVNITVYDATPPTTTLEIGEPKYRKEPMDGWNVTLNTSFTLTAEDEYSDINFSWYTIDGDYYVYTVPFNFSSYGEGEFNLIYGSEDLAGVNETGTLIVIYVDDSEPITTLNIDSPKHGDGILEINVTSMTQFTLSSVDNYVGVESIWWYVNHLANYSEAMTFDFNSFGEGSYTLYYGAWDMLGNNDTTPSSIEVIVDDGKPETTVTIGVPKVGDEVIEIYVTSSTLFSLLASDEIVGVWFTWYTIDSDNYIYDTPFDLSGHGEGTFIFTYGSQDLVENNETGHFLIVHVDDSAPVTTLNIETPKYGNEVSEINVTSTTQFMLNAVDNLVGTQVIWWYVNNIDNYSETIVFDFNAFGGGNYLLYYGARDFLGNNDTTPTSITVRVDDNYPMTNLVVDLPKYGNEAEGIINVTSSTSFLLTGDDGLGVGVAFEWWYINDPLNYTESSSFTLGSYGSGLYILYHGSIDLLGNNDTSPVSLEVKVDDIAPLTDLIVNAPKFGDEADGIVNVTSTTTIILMADDGLGVGAAFEWWFINELENYTTGSSFDLSAYGPGIYTLYYGSIDLLGHNDTTPASISIKVDDNPPTTIITVGTPKYGNEAEGIINVTSFTPVQLTSDDHQGVGTDVEWWYVNDLSTYREGSSFNMSSYGTGSYTVYYGSKDLLGNNDTTTAPITVIVDDFPAASTLSISDPKHGNEVIEVFVSNSTSFSLTEAIDTGVGPSFTWWYVDDIGSYSEILSFNFSSFGPGQYILHYGAEDLLGNNATTATLMVHVDDSPPTTELEIASPKFGDEEEGIINVTSTTQFTLTGNDNGAEGVGVDKIWWYINDPLNYSEDASFNLSSLNPGIYTLYYGAVDKLGNNDTDPAFITIKIDSNAPKTDLEIDLPKYGNEGEGIINVTRKTLFTLFGDDDEGVGVAGNWWYINDLENFSMVDSFNLSAYNSGIYSLYYGAIDLLGNNDTTPASITVKVDDIPPSMNLVVGVPKYGDEATGMVNVTSDTFFYLSSHDGAGVGVAFEWWYINYPLNYSEESVFNLSYYGPGNYKLYYGGMDLLENNESSPASIIVIVDDSPATTTLIIGQPKYGDEILLVNVTSDTTFTLDQAFDEDVGGDFVWWYINDISTYSEVQNFNLSGFGPGPHILHYGASDLLGNNKTTDSLTVIVDDSAPTSDVVVGTPKHGNEAEGMVNVTNATAFILTSEDGVGVDSIWWYITDLLNYSESTTFNLSSFGPGSYVLYYGSSDLLENNDTTPGSLIVIVDDTPPMTTLMIDQPKYGGEVVDINVTRETAFSLSSPFDPGAGPDFVWWYVNDLGNYSETSNFDFDDFGPGAYMLYYGSADLLGNNWTIAFIMVIVDDSPPSTSIFVDTPKYRDESDGIINVTSETGFVLTANDGSGVGPAKEWWYIDDLSNYKESDSFDLSDFSPGIYKLYYGAIDLLGINNTSPNSITVIIDDSPANSTLTIDQPKLGDELNDINVTTTTQFSLSLPYDEVVGGNFTWWYVNDIGNYSESLIFNFSSFGSGRYTLYYGAEDLLENNASSGMITVFVDDNAPKTGLSVDTPKHGNEADGLVNVKSTTMFYLEGDDENGVGVDKEWWYINDILNHSEGIAFDFSGFGPGIYTLYYGAMDLLGNDDTNPSSIIVIVDDTPAFTTVTISQPKHGGEVIDINVTRKTPFTLASPHDNGVGPDFAWWFVNDLGNYSETLLFDFSSHGSGEYTLYYGAADLLGNNGTSDSITVIVDDNAPNTKLKIGTLKLRDLDSDHWNVTSQTKFSLSASDGQSGVDVTWYSIDGEYFEGTEFQLSDPHDGLHVIAWGSLDNLGNEEVSKSTHVYIDNTPPSILVDIGWPNRTSDNLIYVTFSTPIQFIPVDSGVNHTTMYYSRDGGLTYYTYTLPFTISPTTTEVMFFGEDGLGNKANVSRLNVIVDNTDTDGDGLEDMADDDDDNDGLLDIQEDVNQDGYIEMNETDPLNPDTDGDGHNDLVDKYPLDASKWREPTDWEETPILGQYEESFCRTVGLIIIILVILILFTFLVRRRMMMKRADRSWERKRRSK